MVGNDANNLRESHYYVYTGHVGQKSKVKIKSENLGEKMHVQT